MSVPDNGDRDGCRNIGVTYTPDTADSPRRLHLIPFLSLTSHSIMMLTATTQLLVHIRNIMLVALAMADRYHTGHTQPVGLYEDDLGIKPMAART